MTDFIQIPLQRLQASEEEEGCHITVEARLNGRPINLLIDTGATGTILAKDRLHDFFAEADFAPHPERISVAASAEAMPSFLVQVAQFSIGGVAMNRNQLLALDLAQINAFMQTHNLPPVDGILGGDLLLEHRAVIDYRLMALRLEGLEAH